MIIFTAVLVSNLLISIGAYILLWRWSCSIEAIGAAGKEIPAFYDPAKLTGIITGGIAGVSAVAGTLLARYGAREATGNIGRVNLSKNAAERVLERGEDERCDD